jgi:hypothetical protein
LDWAEHENTNMKTPEKIRAILRIWAISQKEWGEFGKSTLIK